MNTPNIACYSMGRFTTVKPNIRFWFLRTNKRNAPIPSGSKLRGLLGSGFHPETPKIAEIFGRFSYSSYLCTQDKQIAE